MIRILSPCGQVYMRNYIMIRRCLVRTDSENSRGAHHTFNDTRQSSERLYHNLMNKIKELQKLRLVSGRAMNKWSWTSLMSAFYSPHLLRFHGVVVDVSILLRPFCAFDAHDSSALPYFLHSSFILFFLIF